MNAAERAELIRLCKLAKADLIAAHAPKSLISNLQSMRTVNAFLKNNAKGE